MITLENQAEQSGYKHEDTSLSQPPSWRMLVRLYYDNEPAGTTSFNLQGYSREEAEHLARHLGENAFVMREIDEFLWGESD